eukprot:196016-Amphidinium_carterae.2
MSLTSCSSTLQGSRLGDDLWPCPLLAELMCRTRKADTRSLVRVVIAACNHLALGRPARPPEMLGTTPVSHAQNEMLQSVASLGRALDKFEQFVGSLEGSRSLLSDASVTRTYGQVTVPAEKQLERCYGFAKNKVASRIKWELPPSFDPRPLLTDSALLAAYLDPDVLLLPESAWPKRVRQDSRSRATCLLQLTWPAMRP